MLKTPDNFDNLHECVAIDIPGPSQVLQKKFILKKTERAGGRRVNPFPPSPADKIGLKRIDFV